MHFLTFVKTIGGATLLLSLCPIAGAAFGQKLYIFIPSEYKPVQIEEMFSEKYPDLKVRAFGNNVDFTTSVSTDRPDAIITKPLVLGQIDGYSTRLQAVHNGSAEEPFVLLSVDKPLAPAAMHGKQIGILDFLGKKEIESFTVDLIGVRPALTRVKKIADLLPLLTMNMVEGLIVSAGQVEYLKKRSNLNFMEVKCNGGCGIAVLAVARDDTPITAAVKNMPEGLKLFLGVDTWK